MSQRNRQRSAGLSTTGGELLAALVRAEETTQGVMPDPEVGRTALRSSVEIRAEVSLARRRAAEWDGPAAELMATYSEFGALLESWNEGTYPGTAEGFAITCVEYLDRSDVVGAACVRESEQQVAVFWARVDAGRWRAPGPRRGA